MFQAKIAIELEEFPNQNNDDADDENENEAGSDGVTEATDESYDVQAVTVPLTICLAIMVGCVSKEFCEKKIKNHIFLDTYAVVHFYFQNTKTGTF